NLMQDLQRDHGVTYMLISHDLGVVDYVCDEVAVMYLGRVVEQTTRERLFEAPAHPYTKALLEAVPRVGGGRRRRRSVLQGGVGSQTHEAAGCPFADRCPVAELTCREQSPVLREIAPSHMASCHFA
ncbi:MAG: ABC transporter ATP-binding protein, partial [Alphaproteobacteria bacterium]|nr:ABC transporter ATP-binding protein [Alphaproteobacteria bacterium]